MNKKSKGINAERELIHLFWSNEWTAIRAAGSGSMKYPCPDVIASNNHRRIAIEAKVTKDSYKYFATKEVNQLKEFSEKSGAEPWLAVKFKGSDWVFFNIKDILPTKQNFLVSLDLAKKKGLTFSELIEEF